MAIKIVDLSMKNDDFPVRFLYVCQVEGFSIHDFRYVSPLK
jgi:hypothetical protein